MQKMEPVEKQRQKWLQIHTVSPSLDTHQKEPSGSNPGLFIVSLKCTLLVLFLLVGYSLVPTES